MAGITFILAGILILGVIALVLAFSLKGELVSGSRWFKYRSFAVLLFTLGFIIHTLGDYLSADYGYTIELSFESFAHVLILISFILFLYASKQVLKISTQHGFR